VKILELVKMGYPVYTASFGELYNFALKYAKPSLLKTFYNVDIFASMPL
jgi:hypothetical protein